MNTTPKFNRLDPEQRREQILAAANALFAERAYERVSIADIVGFPIVVVWAALQWRLATHEPIPSANERLVSSGRYLGPAPHPASLSRPDRRGYGRSMGALSAIRSQALDGTPTTIGLAL